ncbi:biofilm development regulator YmgB/AriR family protein [Kosakonia sp. BK9b]
MLEQYVGYADLPDKALAEYFLNAGESLAEESAILGAVIRNILADSKHITNKAIIIGLIKMLESTEDVVKSDIIRKTLEIVVRHTTDDL